MQIKVFPPQKDLEWNFTYHFFISVQNIHIADKKGTIISEKDWFFQNLYNRCTYVLSKQKKSNDLPEHMLHTKYKTSQEIIE